MLFLVIQSNQFVWGQEDSKWLMFKYDTVVDIENIFGTHQEYCSFLKIEQDTNQFTLYEYGMLQNKKEKTVYFKFDYSGYYVFTEDSSIIDLKPIEVKIYSRKEGQEIKEEKSFPKYLRWNLFLNPYRLIFFNKESESLFDTYSIYLNMVVCQVLDNDQMTKFNSAYERWDHGQFEYPAIDSTIFIDTNKYFLEIPDLKLDEALQIELYYYELEKEGVEFLMFDYIEQSDSLFTLKSESKSNHALVHKHYLMLRNEGYAVRFNLK